MAEETMDPAKQIEALNAALRLQLRSAVQYALTAGTITGFAYQGLAGELAGFAALDLQDARRLAEKVTALGGDPVHEVAPPRFHDDVEEAVQWLIDSESETLQALQDAIEPTGREAASEAVEHRLEHIIMRKQEQVDVLLRASRA